MNGRVNMWDNETESCVEAEGFDQYWEELMGVEESEEYIPDGWEVGK
jgi:hypothetical protein